MRGEGRSAVACDGLVCRWVVKGPRVAPHLVAQRADIALDRNRPVRHVRQSCMVQPAKMGHQLADGNGSWCPELVSRTTHRLWGQRRGLRAKPQGGRGQQLAGAGIW